MWNQENEAVIVILQKKKTFSSSRPRARKHKCSAEPPQLERRISIFGFCKNNAKRAFKIWHKF